MEKEETIFIDEVKGTKEQISRWRELSKATMLARVNANFIENNQELEKSAKNPDEGAFRQVYWYWGGCNLLAEGKTDEAISFFTNSLECGSKHGSICQEDILEIETREVLAESYINSGKIKEGLGQYDELIKLAKDKNRFIYQAGSACERLGKEEEAINYFKKIADEAYNKDINCYKQLAKRDLDRLDDSRCGYKLQFLTEELTNALLKCDKLKLQKLISKTHFSIGLGCHAHYANGLEIIDQLVIDLRKRHIKIVDVEGDANYAKLITSNWKGKWFRGKIDFKLERFGETWQWTSVSINGSPDSYTKCIEPAVKETNQPLPFSLLAPWDRGSGTGSKPFMAGGLGDLLESPIITESAGFFAFLRFIPIVGDIVRTIDLFLAPIRPIERARQLAMATRPCGFGIRGFYYNAITSHTGDDAFAIDFTDYDFFFPASNFWPVLSAVRGMVIFARHTTANNANPSNTVEILTSTRDGQQFASRYLHMAREVIPPVSTGMFVQQGTLIGRIQNTGNSAFPHLHFSIHNQSRPHSSGTTLNSGLVKGISVRATPMDGFRLRDGDESTCVHSTNGGPPIISITSPISFQRINTSVEAAGLFATVAGGALPLNVLWTSSRELRNPISRGLTGSHVFREPGRHVITVTVTDALGRTDSDTVLVDVINSLANVSIVRPEIGERIPVNEVVLLHGRTRDPDTSTPLPERDVTWYLDGSTTANSTGHNGVIGANSLSIGMHRVRFEGVDGGTPISDEHTFEITAAVADRAPVVRIIQPADDSTLWVTENDSTGYYRPVQLVGVADDPEDGPLSGTDLVWTIIDVEDLEETIGTGERLNHNFYARGSFGTFYRVILTATDSAGNTSQATIVLTIPVLG